MVKSNLIELKINKDRIKKNIENLGQIGLSKQGGINRSLASKADIESRNWIKTYWQQNFNISVTTDAAANLWGEYPYSTNKSLKPLIIGSHNDSVPEGGKYDGALGVLLATEAFQTMVEKQIKLKHPLKLISLTGEEPNPYQISTLGSKIISGVVDKKYLAKFKNIETGEPLATAIDRLGGNFKNLESARWLDNDFTAFIECHIEQGRRLFDSGDPVAVVKKITGIYRELVVIDGEANHAGTTDLFHRKDALLSLSWLNVKLREYLQSLESNEPVVGTIGFAEIEPNAANIIPGRVRFNVDLRSGDWGLVEEAISYLGKLFTNLEKIGLKVTRNVILNQKPVDLNAKIIQTFSNTIAADSNLNLKVFTSMAGHDAANMAHIGRSGMLFVKSIDGKSHCKEEYSKIEDIEVAGNVLLQTILDLDRELD
ncbi:Zn-dependent hydrolase [Liquorilactobacillus sicerae]|uniref:Zn-dependent hydrolase n=1 Tax=Liquorilactobacillus sicerae TaxID=1416943 RepID=UPI0024812645|nr:Zn-dependent hydrolase [Liquorilactobacillus sicerae]